MFMREMLMILVEDHTCKIFYWPLPNANPCYMYSTIELCNQKQVYLLKVHGCINQNFLTTQYTDNDLENDDIVLDFSAISDITPQLFTILAAIIAGQLFLPFLSALTNWYVGIFATKMKIINFGLSFFDLVLSVALGPGTMGRATSTGLDIDLVTSSLYNILDSEYSSNSRPSVINPQVLPGATLRKTDIWSQNETWRNTQDIVDRMSNWL